MNKLVVLRLDGDWEEQGFRGILTIKEERDLTPTPDTSANVRSPVSTALEIPGSLPPNPDLVAQLREHWADKYRDLVAPSRAIRPQNIQVTRPFEQRVQECKDSADNLSQRLNNWLRSEQFNEIREQLLVNLSRDDGIRFLIRTEDPQLQKLPWQEWDLIKERYPKAEVALSSTRRTYNPSSPKLTPKVKILAILGHDDGINLEEDSKILNRLPNAKTKFLVKPKRQEINEQLWDQNWDIIFFAGHSETEGDTGRIYINSQESLTIDDLWYGLRRAVARGLKIAIFNSCDGLGLAQRLNDLQIPQMIFMRELVPDLVAQTFLKYFLRAFSEGESFYMAVREARERLQGLEGDIPCATWLPVIYQDLEAGLLTWKELCEGDKQEQQKALRKRILHVALVASVAIAFLLMGVRYLGWLQGWELKAYDQMLRLRPDLGKDDRLLIVTVTEEDLNYQRKMGWEREGSLADAALSQVLKKFEPYKPRAIGLDILHDFPVRNDRKDLSIQMQQNQNFFAICKSNDVANNDPGVKPPPEVPPERLGFSDVLPDEPDNILRRNLWYMSPNLDTPCPVEGSFSLQLALHYLKGENIQPQPTSEGYLQLGKVYLKRLASHGGGYQGVDNNGYQILLNYRTRGDIAPTLTLTEVLQGDFDPKLVQDKIVLIGTIAPSFKDDFYTPFSQKSDQTMRGVFIHAQMVSQILSAVLDQRPLLWVLPQLGEAFWVLGWALAGGFLAWRCRRLVYLFPAGVATIGVLYGFCFVLLLTGGCWVPFVPSALALVATGGTVGGYRIFQN